MAVERSATQVLEGAMSKSKQEQFMDGIRALFVMLGDDPDRDGIQDTPKRVLKAYLEMTDGYNHDPEAILAKRFAQHYDELILLKGIEFTSLCEHHLLPFNGTATVGYLPNSGNASVVGLSKLARLVECYAKRLQIQERMAEQIADALDKYLEPRGVGVILRATHFCMACRGVRQRNAQMVTSVFRGELRNNASARAEFLSL